MVLHQPFQSKESISVLSFLRVFLKNDPWKEGKNEVQAILALPCAYLFPAALLKLLWKQLSFSRLNSHLGSRDPSSRQRFYCLRDQFAMVCYHTFLWFCCWWCFFLFKPSRWAPAEGAFLQNWVYVWTPLPKIVDGGHCLKFNGFQKHSKFAMWNFESYFGIR